MPVTQMGFLRLITNAVIWHRCKANSNWRTGLRSWASHMSQTHSGARQGIHPCHRIGGYRKPTMSRGRVYTQGRSPNKWFRSLDRRYLVRVGTIRRMGMLGLSTLDRGLARIKELRGADSGRVIHRRRRCVIRAGNWDLRSASAICFPLDIKGPNAIWLENAMAPSRSTRSIERSATLVLTPGFRTTRSALDWIAASIFEQARRRSATTKSDRALELVWERGLKPQGRLSNRCKIQARASRGVYHTAATQFWRTTA